MTSEHDGEPLADDPLVVAIDGPSGVGKSTAARRLAERLGVAYLDTGAMYRAVGLRCLEEGIDPEDAEAVEALLADLDLDLEPGEDGGARVLLDGEPVEERIRTPEVGQAASKVSTLSSVRRRLVALQRDYGRRHGAVLEGRDIGTRVFPDTPHKFFLDARPEVRIERRVEQLRAAGRPVEAERVAREIAERDRRDQSRADSPLVCGADAMALDTSERSADEVLEAMLRAVRGRTGEGGEGGEAGEDVEPERK